MLGVFEFERDVIIDRVIDGMDKKASARPLLKPK